MNYSASTRWKHCMSLNYGCCTKGRWCWTNWIIGYWCWFETSLSVFFLQWTLSCWDQQKLLRTMSFAIFSLAQDTWMQTTLELEWIQEFKTLVRHSFRPVLIKWIRGQPPTESAVRIPGLPVTLAIDYDWLSFGSLPLLTWSDPMWFHDTPSFKVTDFGSFLLARVVGLFHHIRASSMSLKNKEPTLVLTIAGRLIMLEIVSVMVPCPSISLYFLIWEDFNERIWRENGDNCTQPSWIKMSFE